MSRSRRNRFIERWAGREWLLRSQQAEARASIQAARKAGDVNEAPLSMGQDAGLINDIPAAGETRAAHCGGGGRDPVAASAEGDAELIRPFAARPAKAGTQSKSSLDSRLRGMSGGENLESFKAHAFVGLALLGVPSRGSI